MNERITIATKVIAALITQREEVNAFQPQTRNDLITEAFLYADLMIARDIADRREGRDPVYGIPVN